MDYFALEIGQNIQSSSNTWYRCVQWLGAGGNANTYLVVANNGPHKGTLFALKLFRKLSAPERRDAFLRESDFLNSCSHPSIMRVYDTGAFSVTTPTPREYPFVLAEYLPVTLFDLLRTRTSSIPQRISYSLQLMSALSYLAALDPPVIHRDIKPKNVFVKGHTVVLGDFGLMKRLSEDDAEGRKFFKESVGVGMPYFYRTPDLVEYLRAGKKPTAKSDVFQLGLVLAELFTGRNPCVAAHDIENDVVLEPLGTIPGALGARVAGLLKRMLDLNPDTRQSAAELMDGWLGLFQAAVTQAHDLDGKVF